MRLRIIDGFRGYFLFFMMVAHAQLLLHAFAGAINHHSFGWVEDAQGFVFLSGLVVGMVYGRRLTQQGERAMAAGIRARIVHIWLHHAGLVVVLAAAALLLPLAGLGSDLLVEHAAQPVAFAIASFLMVTGAPHMGILPMYVVFMLVTPWVLRAFRDGHAPTVAALSLTLWFVAQTGLPDQVELPVEAVLAAAGAPINMGIYFGVLGWQVLYLAGLWFGWKMAQGTLDLRWLFSPEAARVFRVMVALWLALGVFDALNATRIMPDAYNNWIFFNIDRGTLAPVYVVAAANALYVVAWLVLVAPVSGGPVARRVSAVMTWVVSLPALVMLGRHSLTVFVAHVVLVYMLSVAMYGVDPQALPDWLRDVGVLAMTLPLFLVAWLRDRGQRRAVAGSGRAA